MTVSERLRNAIHMESARIAPQTSELIEAAKAALEEIDSLENQIDDILMRPCDCYGS
jgi:hypothetical protein